MSGIIRRHPHYVLGAALLLATILVAALRSQGLGVTLGAEPTPVATEPSAFEWFDEGMTLWDGRCYGCHAELTYVPELYEAEGGREYLLDMMLVGVRGEVNVLGDTFDLRHRPYADTFDDEEMSALLNMMLVAWDNLEGFSAEPDFYTPDEVAAARQREPDPAAVLEGRPNPWE